jgi:hypothetical protein
MGGSWLVDMIAWVMGVNSTRVENLKNEGVQGATH